MIAPLLLILVSLMPSSFLHTQENKIERSELLRPFFEKLEKGNTPVRLVHLGDSHVRGHVFTVEARRCLEEAWGSRAVEEQQISYRTSALAQETGKPGLVYHAMGVNGAQCSHFNTEGNLEKICELKPDLIILSFGTNEAQGNYVESTHRLVLDSLVSSLRRRCPKATIMLTTPPGAYRMLRIRHRRNGRNYYTYQRQPNPNTQRVTSVLRDYAQKNGLPLWDLYNVVGGQKYGLRNWTGANMMRRDRIHYTDAGYRLMGGLLAEALINAKEKNDTK